MPLGVWLDATTTERSSTAVANVSPTLKQAASVSSVWLANRSTMTFSASSASASDDSLALSMDEERETTPAEDRERIIQLGIAITWIAQERVSEQKTCLTSLLV